jgi:hypothetical protein
MTSQKINDNNANICEAINQIRMGVRDRTAGFGSKVILLREVRPAKASRRMLRRAEYGEF